MEAPAYDLRRFYLAIQVVLLVLGTRDSGLDTSTLLACKWFLLAWISLGRAEEGDQL